MKILCVGDPHFKGTHIEESNQMVNGVLYVIDTERPDMVIIMGDVLDKHDIINLKPFVRAVEFIKECAKRALTYVLIGNHDRLNNQDFMSNIHPFAGLSVPNCEVVDHTMLRVIQGLVFTFVPYVPPGRFLEALSIVDTVVVDETIVIAPTDTIPSHVSWRDSIMLFAHQEFKGCTIGTKTSEEGDVWPKEYPLVISGHIHEFQMNDNVIYVGTPYQHTFGESSDKALMLIDTDQMTQVRIPLNIPVKMTIKFSAKEYLKDAKSIVIDGRLRIIVEGSHAEIKPLLNTPITQQLRSKGVKVEFRTTDSSTDYIVHAPSAVSSNQFIACLTNELREKQHLMKLSQQLYNIP